MAIKFHPDPSTLMSYAAGGLNEALSAVVCAHIAMCPTCARDMRSLQCVGGVLLDRIEPTPMARAVPIMALRAGEADHGVPQAVETDPGADIPAPLHHLVGTRIDEIRWRRLGMGIWHVPLKVSRSGYGDLRLLRVAPGQSTPEHGHGGTELTLILQGSYRDEHGHYWPGDVADLDTEMDHRPMADPTLGCVCIIASERPARFKSLLGRMIQPLIGF